MGKYYVPTKGTASWKQLLADSEKQWKPGFSAYELAHCWENATDLPTCVQRAFNRSQNQLFQDVKILYGFPEYKVPLDGGSTSSQNDLYVLAKSNNELLTIMVEGKVSEPFGETVETWLGPNPSKGKGERLDQLLVLLNLSKVTVQDKRYQLLHRTASALIEARSIKANNAMMLVHSFSETGKWFEDYADFVQLFQLLPEKDTIVGPVLLDGVNLYFGWVTGKKSQVMEGNYHIDKSLDSQSQLVQLWSSKRLQFEPKNWMKEMRNELRECLRQLTPIKNGTLYCKFCTSEGHSYFDVENVLLYNVGSGSFSHISNHHLIIERTFEKIPSIENTSVHKHYHLYKYTTGENLIPYWKKDNIVIQWNSLQLPSLQEKPHEYWYRMKKLICKVKSLPLINDTNYGIKINLGVPSGKKVNLTSICKPLLDGIISAFHKYSGDDLDEMSNRLAQILGKEKKEIAELLLEDQFAILGNREVIRKFKNGVQWNPADDCCYQIELNAYPTTGTDFQIDGEVYTIREL